MRTVFLLLLIASSFAGQALYPAPPVAGDMRSQNAMAVVELALRKVPESDWVMTVVNLPMERSRIEFELKRGKIINIYSMPASKQNDAVLLRVPYPIDKGLLGYRIALTVHSATNGPPIDISSFEALQRRRACLHRDWVVTGVFKENGLPVVEATTYEENFVNLVRNSCDYFSRGLSEITGEFQKYRERFPALAIEQNALIRLPLALYLYVSPNQPELYDALTLGLERAKADGSFDALIRQQFQQATTQLNIDARSIVELQMSDQPEQQRLPDGWLY